MIRTKRSDKIRMIKDINITPFTDVCLVLLIIFMVTASALTKEKNLPINLPKAVQGQAPEAATVTVRIASESEIMVNEQPVKHEDLKAVLQARYQSYDKDNPNSVIVVKADENIPYRLVIETIDIGRQVGYARVGLAAREPDNATAR